MDPVASEPVKPLSNFTPQSEPSKFIRTYAKDFAALSGHAPEGIQAVPTNQTAANIEADGVALPDYDLSPVNHAEPASPKEFEQETVDLKESDSEGIFKGKTNISPQKPEPDREAILARLRAKVSAERTVEATAPAAEIPIRVAAPDFSRMPEPVLPIPLVSKEPLVPAPVLVPPVSAAPPETPSPLHTYSSDFADHIDSASGTTFSVLAAQSDAGQTPKPAHRKRSFVPLLAGVAMLVIGIGAIAGAYYFTKQGSVIPVATSVPSLIPFDESVEVKGTGQDLMQAISNAAQSGSVSGNIVVTYVTLATSTGSALPQPGGVLIKDLDLPAPSILLRNILDSSTVGYVNAGAESRPFMILKVSSYERTFAGMLAWEPTMASDLATFYPAYADAAPIGTSTASSSPQVLPTTAPTAFVDAVVSNYDVRILRDAAGRSLMVYGYYGQDTLIIARDEAAFTALVSRLRAAGT